MAKYSETLLELDTPIKRSDHKGYLIYLYGNEKGDGLITRICRSPLKTKHK